MLARILLDVLAQMVDKLGAHPVAIQIPLGAEADFLGVIDLIDMKANVYSDEKDKGETFDVVDIPAEYQDQAKEYREKLIESASDADDGLNGEISRRRRDIPGRAYCGLKKRNSK